MADIKWSQFPSATPGNSDEVVGLHSGDNARFSIANIVAAVRNGLANIFVPKSDVGVADGVASLDSTGKVPSTQLPPIASTAADVTYDNTQSGLTADDVQEAIDELAAGAGGGSADDITYDPTTSGASATNVQDALDEAFGDLDDKQAKITASGILKGDGQGGVSAATPGTDYQEPLTIDSTPTANSTNPVQSGGVYSSVAGYGLGVKLNTQTPITDANDSTLKTGWYCTDSSTQNLPSTLSGTDKNCVLYVATRGEYIFEELYSYSTLSRFIRFRATNSSNIYTWFSWSKSPIISLDEYVALQGQIGYVERGYAASRNYTAGQFICWNGLTYTADTNIALGATLSASGGNKNLTECVGGGFNAAPVDLSASVTFNSSAVASIVCELDVIGKLAVLSLTINLKSLSTLQGVELAYLPSRAYPVSEMNIVGMFIPNFTSQSSGASPIRVYLDSVGKLRCPNHGGYAGTSSTTNSRVYLSFAYYTV